jgi:hypothetical protein
VAEKLFFGNSDLGSTGVLAGGFHCYSEFPCTKDGFITKLKYYAVPEREIKPAAYLKDGSAYNIIWSNDTGVTITSGWNDVIPTPFAVANGEYYALTFNSDGGSNPVTITTGTTMGYKALTYSTFSSPVSFDPAADSYTQRTDRDLLIEAYGWEPPVISSISDSDIQDGQTGVTIGGTDFMDSGATLELCDGPVYATATKVTQTVTNQTDSSLEFTVQRGGLSLGTAYLFVTTDLGQQNSTGYEVTLVGYPAISNVEPGSMQNSDLIVITGTDFGASGATAYVGDNSTYTSANKYTLTIFSQSDTEIYASMDNEGSFYGSGWVYVKESGGAYNDNGYGITVLEPDSPTVFYGDVAGFGNNPFGRHSYGGMSSEIGPVFFDSTPSDGDSNVSTLHVSCKTEIYGFSSRVHDVRVEISEDGGGFVDAYYNGGFVSPYNGAGSWLSFHQSDPQKMIAKIVKTEPWEEDVNIVIRVTATDQFGAEATKMAHVEW